VAPSRPRTAGIAVALLALAAGVLLCGPLLPTAEPGPMLLSADAEGASTSTATDPSTSAPPTRSEPAEEPLRISRGGAARPDLGPDVPGHDPGRGLNWAALAECESGGNPRQVSADGYFGLYQVSISAWRSVGGLGSPVRADPYEQTVRAQQLYARFGADLWPVCSRYL
jgi:hypothetical protein